MTPEESKAELEDPRHEMLLNLLRNDIQTEVARDLPGFRARESEFSAIDPGDLREPFETAPGVSFPRFQPTFRTYEHTLRLRQRLTPLSHHRKRFSDTDSHPDQISLGHLHSL